MNGTCSTLEMFTGFWYGDQKEGGHFEELTVDIG